MDAEPEQQGGGGEGDDSNKGEGDNNNGEGEKDSNSGEGAGEGGDEDDEDGDDGDEEEEDDPAVADAAEEAAEAAAEKKKAEAEAAAKALAAQAAAQAATAQQASVSSKSSSSKKAATTSGTGKQKKKKSVAAHQREAEVVAQNRDPADEPHWDFTEEKTRHHAEAADVKGDFAGIITLLHHRNKLQQAVMFALAELKDELTEERRRGKAADAEHLESISVRLDAKQQRLAYLTGRTQRLRSQLPAPQRMEVQGPTVKKVNELRRGSGSEKKKKGVGKEKAKQQTEKGEAKEEAKGDAMAKQKKRRRSSPVVTPSPPLSPSSSSATAVKRAKGSATAGYAPLPRFCIPLGKGAGPYVHAAYPVPNIAPYCSSEPTASSSSSSSSWPPPQGFQSVWPSPERIRPLQNAPPDVVREYCCSSLCCFLHAACSPRLSLAEFEFSHDLAADIKLSHEQKGLLGFPHRPSHCSVRSVCIFSFCC